MSRGITIADFVQQVFYAIYKVRLDVDASKEGAYHSKSDKFKEVVMEANFVLQEFQKEADWNFLRERWEIGPAHNDRFGMPQEVKIPEGVYKLCTGYGDAVRLHKGSLTYQIPFEEARTSNRRYTQMFDECGRLNMPENGQRATFVGDVLTFNRPWRPGEVGGFLETDVISYIPPLHICDDTCPDRCPKAYDELLFKWMPDPYYLVIKTASKRAYADPSCSDMIQPLTDDATKMLSAIRENDSAHTTPDSYETCPLGYVSVL